MRFTSWSILGIALGLVGLVFPYAMAAEQASRPLPSAQLDVCFISSSPVELQPVCMVEGDKRRVQNIGAEG